MVKHNFVVNLYTFLKNTFYQGQMEIPAGKYIYSFSFVLPKSGLPQSYEGRYGHIRYYIKAIAVRSWSNFVDKMPLTIFTSLDLNDLPYLRVSFLHILNNSYANIYLIMCTESHYNIYGQSNVVLLHL